MNINKYRKKDKNKKLQVEQVKTKAKHAKKTYRSTLKVDEQRRKISLKITSQTESTIEKDRTICQKTNKKHHKVVNSSHRVRQTIEEQYYSLSLSIRQTMPKADIVTILKEIARNKKNKLTKSKRSDQSEAPKMNVLVDLRGVTLESVPRLVQKFERFGRIVDHQFKKNDCFYKAVIGCVRYENDLAAEMAAHTMQNIIFENSVVLVQRF